ncbi:MAG: endonuclease/exonuclease/phosphatase family protein [Isosphaeraceae bacterium]
MNDNVREVPMERKDRSRRQGNGGFLLILSWIYAVIVLAALVLIRWVGDSWSGVILLLFAPRWVFLVPLTILVVASGIRPRVSNWAIQGATGLIIAGPLMGISLPIHHLYPKSSPGMRVRIVSFNVGSHMRIGELKAWLEREKVDLLCLQEAGGRNSPLLKMLADGGWHLSRHGAIASRWPMTSESPEYPTSWAPRRRFTSHLESLRVQPPSGFVFQVASVHLPTVREGIEDFLTRFDTAGLRLQSDWWRLELSRVLGALLQGDHPPLLIGGDFNMPADDSTMAALRLSYRFAFEEAGWGYGYTRPAQASWVRIDHILASPEWHVSACWIGPDLGSDHLPILAEFVLPAAP